MDWVKELTDVTTTIYDTAFDKRDGSVIPDTTDVALKDGAVSLDAAFLYADLAGSARIASVCPWTTTAKIIRAYLECATRLVKAYKGEIKSFDGDRVMGVFIGDLKNTHATRCAREIDYAVYKIIGPLAQSKFDSVQKNISRIDHCVGVDAGASVAVRAGIRASNDLVWIGKPPSFAAKLSDVRTYPHTVYISNRTYSKLADGDKKKSDGADLWEKATFTFAGTSETVWRTASMLKP